LASPLAPLEVADPACQEIQVESPDLGNLPIPWFFEHETGPYVTAGAIVARDVDSGASNLSIARLKPLGGSRALAGIAPNHHLAVLGRRAAARGETLPVAVTIGNHPAVLLASCLYLDLGADELHHAGGLLGEPIEVARTAEGLAVPAECELVLEGRLDYTELVEEGLVSEFHGMYEDYGSGAVATFHRLTMRRDYARPDRDLIVVPGGAADRAEPLELRGRVAKLGIDATRKASDRADHRTAEPPAQASADARRRLAELR
jgi:2,5-furandicarboxylate decarboxylase 1